ncbi:hypothetical protein [Corallococcus sp. M7]
MPSLFDSVSGSAVVSGVCFFAISSKVGGASSVPRSTKRGLARSFS